MNLSRRKGTRAPISRKTSKVISGQPPRQGVFLGRGAIRRQKDAAVRKRLLRSVTRDRPSEMQAREGKGREPKSAKGATLPKSPRVKTDNALIVPEVAISINT